MNLYLDLVKAGGQVPSTSTDTPDDRKASRSYNESFSRRPGGVSGGDASHDDPHQGGKWGHGEPLDDELEDDRKRDTQIAQERGIVNGGETTEKSEAADMFKSISFAMAEHVTGSMPDDAEVEFLTTECYKSESVVDSFGRVENIRVPYTRDDVVRGRARIVGSERSRFNDWLQERFQKSLGKLAR